MSDDLHDLLPDHEFRSPLLPPEIDNSRNFTGRFVICDENNKAVAAYGDLHGARRWVQWQHMKRGVIFDQQTGAKHRLRRRPR